MEGGEGEREREGGRWESGGEIGKEGVKEGEHTHFKCW